MAQKKVRAFAYMRTSSAANTGAEKDSDKRQMAAISAYANAHGYTIVQTFYDAAVSGADPIEARPGMRDLLEALEGEGINAIITESPDRFARDTIVQALGHRLLQDRGVDLIPTTAPDFFTTDTPTSELVRTILGAVSTFEKQQTVAKLKGARDRASARAGRRIEGRKPVPADAVDLAKRLYRKSPKTGKRRSLRTIASAMAEEGCVAPSGAPYNANSVRQMLVRAGVYVAA